MIFSSLLLFMPIFISSSQSGNLIIAPLHRVNLATCGNSRSKYQFDTLMFDLCGKFPIWELAVNLLLVKCHFDTLPPLELIFGKLPF